MELLISTKWPPRNLFNTRLIGVVLGVVLWVVQFIFYCTSNKTWNIFQLNINQCLIFKKF